MKELFSRLLARPGLTTEMIAASLIANILALASPIFVMQVLNRYVAHGVQATLLTLSAGVVIAIVLELAFRQIRMRLAASINATSDRTIANGAFGTLTGTKTAYIDKLSFGLRQEMIAGTEKLQAAFNAANMASIMDVPFALMFIGVLYLLNPAIALVVACFVALSFLISVLTLASLRAPTLQMQVESGRRGGLVSAAVQAGDTVRVFNGSGFIRKQWQDRSAAYLRLSRKIMLRQGFVQSLGTTLQAVMGAIVISLGAVQVVAGTMDVGVMIGANILAARALGPIIKFAMMSEQFAKARQALLMFNDFAKLPTERVDGTALSQFSGTIEFSDMAFSHPAAKTPLFESMNLKLEPASILVFSGANGTGKTTLARMMVGLLEPTRGRILVDGVDLAQIAPEWWRKQVMYLPQEPKFLNGTIADNISLINPEMDHARLQELIDLAGLRQFVDQSPDGSETHIVGGGKNLSLGIRRRIALARALAGDGRVMVIDEPTEGLDAEGAQAVLEAINRASGNGATVLIFTHDPQILKSVPHYVDLNVKPIPTLVRKPVDAAQVVGALPPSLKPQASITS
ncbi:MAG: ATP-binding cassette domain-containing protein [Rhodospirillales bacterium]|nr:ATP-binding cassette domain-containing protein [Rhodospirillales bacterium]